MNNTGNKDVYSQAQTAKSESTRPTSTRPPQRDEDRARKHNHKQEMYKLAHLRFQAPMVQTITSSDNQTVNSLADQYKTCNGALQVRSIHTLP